MKVILTCLVIVVVLHLANGLKCKACHSEVGDCKTISGEVETQRCIIGSKVSCFEMHYYDKETGKNMTERGCWPFFANPTADPNICNDSKEKIEKSGGRMIECNQCKTDNCNNKDF